MAELSDSEPLRTPVTVQVRPADGAAAFLDQAVTFRFRVGILESLLPALEWRQCGGPAVGP